MATSNKYDRQLRLWGSKGQKCLSETTIVLIGACAVGTETLKNLVLPGVGGIHILDDVVSTGTIEGCNFFHPFDSSVTGNSSSSRAEVTMKYLGELNEDVKADFTHVDDLSRLNFADWLSQTFDPSQDILIVAADIPRSLVTNIASACQRRKCPLLHVRAYGLIGMVQLQVQDHFIMESKPDNELPDLRLSQPFSDLTDLVNQTNLQTVSDMDHGHIPFVIILIKALERWRSESTQNNLPSTPEQKAQFRDVVKTMARNYANQLNFQEAFQDAYLAYSPRQLPYEVTELMESVIQKGTFSNKYQIMLLALHEFMSLPDSLQQPPLNGAIPDMTSSTQIYIKLQNAYKAKANHDRHKMGQIVQSLVEKHGLSPEICPSDDDLDTFCKNIHNIRYLNLRSLAYEDYDYTKEEKEDLLMTTFDAFEQKPEHTPLLWYIALEACEIFFQNFKQYPGKDSNHLTLENDAQIVQKYIHTIAQKMDLADSDLFKTTILSPDAPHAKEMVRYNNAEVHNICSVIGGVASQEAVKLITKQYVPIENTFIFNGIAGVGAVYKL